MKGNGKLNDSQGIMVEMLDPQRIGFIRDGDLLFSITPEQASTMAEHLARIAFAAHTGREADDRGSELVRQIKAKAVDEIRPRLITRHAQLLRSFLKKNPKPTEPWMAERLVDALLKEVT